MIGPAEIEAMLAEHAEAVARADPEALTKSPVWTPSSGQAPEAPRPRPAPFPKWPHAPAMGWAKPRS
jgi:hypothetical protein